MTRADPRHAAFDRHPPAELRSDEAPLNGLIEYHRLTNLIFASFGWQAHPVGAWGLFRWSATASNGGIYSRTFAESSGDGSCINVFVSSRADDEDGQIEIIENNLQLLLRLVRIYNELGIGVPNFDLVAEVVRDLALTGAGHPPGSMPTEVFAALVAQTGEVAA